MSIRSINRVFRVLKGFKVRPTANSSHPLPLSRNDKLTFAAETSLQSFLAARGYPSIKLIYPPPELCTDNAAMIAWAGIEMFRAGHTTPLVCRALRKWSLEELLTPPNGN